MCQTLFQRRYLDTLQLLTKRVLDLPERRLLLLDCLLGVQHLVGDQLSRAPAMKKLIFKVPSCRARNGQKRTSTLFGYRHLVLPTATRDRFN